MGKKKEETVAEVLVEQTGVTVNLDVDANDPRKFPPVDGNTQPVVDINKPA
jgi:hypothetical protein